MTTCHSVKEVRAAALADHDAFGEPLDQNGADLVAAIMQPHQKQDAA